MGMGMVRPIQSLNEKAVPLRSFIFRDSRTFSIFQVLKNSTNYMRNVCGLNVHKDNVFMCILKENGDKIEEKFGVLTPEHIFYFKCR
jgi:hypothetical protein